MVCTAMARGRLSDVVIIDIMNIVLTKPTILIFSRIWFFLFCAVYVADVWSRRFGRDPILFIYKPVNIPTVVFFVCNITRNGVNHYFIFFRTLIVNYFKMFSKVFRNIINQGARQYSSKVFSTLFIYHAVKR